MYGNNYVSAINIYTNIQIYMYIPTGRMCMLEICLRSQVSQIKVLLISMRFVRLHLPLISIIND